MIAEAFILGIILLIISIPVMGILHMCFPEDYSGCQNLPTKSKNKYYIATIIIGMLTHITFEYSGAKKLYCSRGSHPASW